jgi:hypothetical protein
MLPSYKALFKAFENVDPPTKRQKAITPRLLRKLLEASHHPSLLDTAPAVAADLVIGAFFFAMRSCEYSKPAIPGKTKCINLDGLIFRTTSNQVIEHQDPALLTKAEYITVTFVNQKNGQKMDSRTQRRTKDPHLCPVIRYGTQVQRILRTVPGANGSTTINTIALTGKAGLITNTYILEADTANDVLLFRRKRNLRFRLTRNRKQIHSLGSSHGLIHQRHLHSEDHDPRPLVL